MRSSRSAIASRAIAGANRGEERDVAGESAEFEDGPLAGERRERIGVELKMFGDGPGPETITLRLDPCE